MMRGEWPSRASRTSRGFAAVARMAFSVDRTATVKLEASPSSLWCNLAAAPHKLAFAHKDAVYLMDARAVEGRAAPSLDKLVLRDPPSHVTSVSWALCAGRFVLLVTTRGWFGVWDADVKVCLGSVPLSVAGVAAVLANGYRAAAMLPASDKLVVGTSWGDILPCEVAASSAASASAAAGGSGAAAAGAGGSSAVSGVSAGVLRPGSLLKSAHKASTSAIAADMRHLITGDDNGTIVQWAAGSLTPVAAHEGAGHPVTGLRVRDNTVIAAYASGHVRIFHAGDTAASSYIQAEIAGHARCITALDLHPHQFTFATVSEDCRLVVWSLPEMASSGRAKVTVDLAAKISDTQLTGVQFLALGGKAAAPHIVANAYDSHVMRVFLGL